MGEESAPRPRAPRPRHALALVLAGVAAAAAAVPAALWLARSPATPDPYERLAAELGCQCGTCPNRPIATCGCGFADRMLAELRAAVDAGGTEEAIVAAFVDRYGPNVRIVPATSGLDLAAWLAPLLLLLVGAVAVAAVLIRWRQAGPTEPDAPPRPEGGEGGAAPRAAGRHDDPYLAVVERELEEYPEP